MEGRAPQHQRRNKHHHRPQPAPSRVCARARAGRLPRSRIQVRGVCELLPPAASWGRQSCVAEWLGRACVRQPLLPPTPTPRRCEHSTAASFSAAAAPCAAGAAAVLAKGNWSVAACVYVCCVVGGRLVWGLQGRAGTPCAAACQGVMHRTHEGGSKQSAHSRTHRHRHGRHTTRSAATGLESGLLHHLHLLDAAVQTTAAALQTSDAAAAAAPVVKDEGGGGPFDGLAHVFESILQVGRGEAAGARAVARACTGHPRIHRNGAAGTNPSCPAPACAVAGRRPGEAERALLLRLCHHRAHRSCQGGNLPVVAEAGWLLAAPAPLQLATRICVHACGQAHQHQLLNRQIALKQPRQLSGSVCACDAPGLHQTQCCTLCLLPWQVGSTVALQALQPRVKELQAKYANDTQVGLSPHWGTHEDTNACTLPGPARCARLSPAPQRIRLADPRRRFRLGAACEGARPVQTHPGLGVAHVCPLPSPRLAGAAAGDGAAVQGGGREPPGGLPAHAGHHPRVHWPVPRAHARS